jgi:hypothetical protein
MDARTAFENYIKNQNVCLKTRADGKYLMKSVRAAFAQFREVYELGFKAGCKVSALQALAGEERELDMEY